MDADLKQLIDMAAGRGDFLVAVSVAAVVILGVFAVVRLATRVRARDIRHLGSAATTEPTLVALRPLLERLAYIASILPQKSHKQWARRTLLRANLQNEWSPELLEAMKLGTAVAVFFGVNFLTWFMEFGFQWAIAFVIALVCYFVPDLMIMSRASERQTAMRKEMPFVIDLLAVSAEAGLAFQQAIRNVVSNASKGKETEKSELIKEFEHMLNNMSMGRSQAEALLESARRVDLEEFHTFANAILQAERLGTPVSETLKRQSEELRIRLAARVEAKANQAPVLILFPLIMFIFPVTVWFILGPTLLRVLLGEFG